MRTFASNYDAVFNEGMGERSMKKKFLRSRPVRLRRPALIRRRSSPYGPWDNPASRPAETFIRIDRRFPELALHRPGRSQHAGVIRLSLAALRGRNLLNPSAKLQAGEYRFLRARHRPDRIRSSSQGRYISLRFHHPRGQ